jgi:hypothetical protein
MCQIIGMREVTIIEEGDRHLCMSCWCERERNRSRREKAGIFET